MADPRRNRPGKRTDDTAPLSGAIPVDDDTANALALFNARLVRQAEEERAAKRVERATRAKDAAAAQVRALESDTKATVEQRNEAAAAYHAAVEALDRAKKGEPEPPKASDDTEAPAAAAALVAAPAEDSDEATASGDTDASDDTDAAPAED